MPLSVNKDGLVPVLRFPEFWEVGEWKNELFEKIYSFKTTNSLSRDKLNYKQGTVKNIHYGDIHTKFSTLFDIEKENVPYINPADFSEKIKPDSYCIEGDMIFADASEDTDDIGKCIEIASLNNEKLVSGLHTLLARQIQKKLVTGFGGYLFKSNRIREQIKKESQGSKVLGLSGGRLSSISVAYPADEKEQQKIADCLTSIDELITAQTQKLDALKTHKKGLMQQLFPAEGETVPKLRFPEFRDKGEWNELKLKKSCERIMDGTHFSPKTKDGPRMYLTSKNIQNGTIDLSNVTYISEEEHRQIYNRCPVKLNDVFLTKDGANTGNCALNTIDSEFSLLSSVTVLRGKPSLLDQKFLYQIILSDRTQRLIRGAMSGQAITRITLEKIGNFAVSITSKEEQQKIANCLTSIDELITTQTQKLAALKTHKKGLMQQLFPAMNDDCMDAGGTSPRMDEGRATQEQLPRATQDAKAEVST